MNKDKKFTQKEMQEVEKKVFYNLRSVTKRDNSFTFSKNIVNEYNRQQKESTKNLFF